MKYFDMMYYYLATFYKRFFKKRSAWDLQAIFVITITQFMFLLDMFMLIIELSDIKRVVSIYEKIGLLMVGLIFLYFNVKKYEKKYQHYKSIWGIHQGSKKNLYTFLTFFTVVFAWCFVLILGFVFK